MAATSSRSERIDMHKPDDAQSEQTASHLARQSKLVRHYYARVPFDEISHRSAGELSAAAMSHWNMASRRKADECLVRIYNPVKKKHGWESPNTIIEITTTDKPFLVRSVSLAITNLGFGINEFFHPIFHLSLIHI